eukprot:1177432-Prorocentrum_minimum.AAC.3
MRVSPSGFGFRPVGSGFAQWVRVFPSGFGFCPVGSGFAQWVRVFPSGFGFRPVGSGFAQWVRVSPSGFGFRPVGSGFAPGFSSTVTLPITVKSRVITFGHNGEGLRSYYSSYWLRAHRKHLCWSIVGKYPCFLRLIGPSWE